MPKNDKPVIEDSICELLGGDARKNALDFVAYLRENKLNPQWSAANAWKVNHKTFSVCFIRLHGSADYHNLAAGDWHILPFIGEHDANALSSEHREIAWANKKECKTCGQCGLQLDGIFGKKFATACEGSILFRNPDAAAVQCAKKLIELRKLEIKEGKARKHQYVAMRDRQ